VSVNYPGYLVPENPSPDGFICLKVFIPNDDVYLYAFSGAYQYFGKWLAWERDESHKGALAALAWREAIHKTFSEGWLNCGENDVCENCNLIPVILEQIRELNNMNINVNCGCGCGCGCTSQVTPQPPTDDDYPPSPVPPIPTPEDESGLLWKCNMSHYCAYLWRKWGMYAADLQSTNIVQDCQSVFLNLGVNPPNYAQRLAYSSSAILLMGGSNSTAVAAAYDPNYDAVVCAIYSAPTAAAALDNLREIDRQLMGAIGAGMDWLALLLPLAVAFTPQEDDTNLPPSYRDRVCTMCTGTIPSPGQPIPVESAGGKWWLIPMPASGTWLDVVNNGGATIAYAPNVWQQSPLLNLTYHEVDVTIPNLAQIITAMDSEFGANLPGNVVALHGHYLQFVYSGINPQDGFEFSDSTGDANGFVALAGKTCAAYNSDIMTGGGSFDAVYETFVNGADEQIAYGNAVMNAAKAYFGLNSYGSNGAASISIRHWYICELEV